MTVGFNTDPSVSQSLQPVNLKSANLMINSVNISSLNLPLSSKSLETAVWLLEETQQHSTLAILEAWPLSIKSTVFTFKRISQGEFEITEVYKPFPEHAIISNVIGHWSWKTGLSMTSVSIWERRRNLSGLQLRIAITPVS